MHVIVNYENNMDNIAHRETLENFWWSFRNLEPNFGSEKASINLKQRNTSVY